MATDSESSIYWLEREHDSEEEKREEKKEREEEEEESRRQQNSSSVTPQKALKRQHSTPSHHHLPPSTSQTGQLFSHKCAELQCYIQPLSLILNGLRSGRYRERLSSFQESVAMDRIQRIMGVLQNPCLGEKYINIILKMEDMLKSWFPQVQLPQQPLAAQTRDHGIPSKKPKLCSSLLFSPFTNTEPGPKTLRVTDLTPPEAYSASNVKWLHTSPICSPVCSPTAEQSQAKDRDLTQDNAVSSSTDCHIQTETRAQGPPLGKIKAPCLEKLLKSTESIITHRMDGSS
ncbi:hypothetical protein NQD34_003890 [Periophthalmus magnuspinnatus]|uniref:circadian-associated transcriptional repressor n=1 Tax=Periophthalmus magnuspinnatus TaxID=409849 RepID=UPI0022BC3B12|nr:circadian-associated transcriptional repressor [Periophthalmus magnuspinnatus]KAJ0028893.1 hypothetical protein NQD34_003890 [Periophthalmus magnuspinnatus]